MRGGDLGFGIIYRRGFRVVMILGWLSVWIGRLGLWYRGFGLCCRMVWVFCELCMDGIGWDGRYV